MQLRIILLLLIFSESVFGRATQYPTDGSYSDSLGLSSGYTLINGEKTTPEYSSESSSELSSDSSYESDSKSTSESNSQSGLKPCSKQDSKSGHSSDESNNQIQHKPKESFSRHKLLYTVNYYISNIINYMINIPCMIRNFIYNKIYNCIYFFFGICKLIMTDIKCIFASILQYFYYIPIFGKIIWEFMYVAKCCLSYMFPLYNWI